MSKATIKYIIEHTQPIVTEVSVDATLNEAYKFAFSSDPNKVVQNFGTSKTSQAVRTNKKVSEFVQAGGTLELHIVPRATVNNVNIFCSCGSSNVSAKPVTQNTSVAGATVEDI